MSKDIQIKSNSRSLPPNSFSATGHTMIEAVLTSNKKVRKDYFEGNLISVNVTLSGRANVFSDRLRAAIEAELEAISKELD